MIGLLDGKIILTDDGKVLASCCCEEPCPTGACTTDTYATVTLPSQFDGSTMYGENYSHTQFTLVMNGAFPNPSAYLFRQFSWGGASITITACNNNKWRLYLQGNAPCTNQDGSINWGIIMSADVYITPDGTNCPPSGLYNLNFFDYESPYGEYYNPDDVGVITVLLGHPLSILSVPLTNINPSSSRDEICYICQERPQGCWRAEDCNIKRAHARTNQIDCPLGKWLKLKSI